MRNFINFVKTYSLPLFLMSTSLLLALGGDAAVQWLQYDRNAISEGQWWRLISGHLLHLGWAHLWMNLAALAIIWYVCGHFLSSTFWWIATLACAVIISICLFVFMPELRWYVGLSGLLHSLIAIGAIAGMAQKNKEFILLLVLLCAKVAFEQVNGALSTSMYVEGNIIVDAHLYGLVSGVISGFFMQSLGFIKAGPAGRNAD